MTRRRLPIGIQNFRRLRETGSYYVDKTPLIRNLVEQSDNYFLSRPRRFGKSVLLDTLGSLFACHEPLFRGLFAAPGHAVRPVNEGTGISPVVALVSRNGGAELLTTLSARLSISKGGIRPQRTWPAIRNPVRHQPASFEMVDDIDIFTLRPVTYMKSRVLHAPPCCWMTRS